MSRAERAEETHDILDRLLVQPLQQVVEICHLLVPLHRLLMRNSLSLPIGSTRMSPLVVRRDRVEAIDASRAVVGNGCRRRETSRVGTAGMDRRRCTACVDEGKGGALEAVVAGDGRRG